MTLFNFAMGLCLLVGGGELLVRGASRLAAALGVSPLVIGLTVVAFGTSSPEAAVSLRSTLTGQPDIALGNVVGSNICNVLLVLGLSAAIAPLVVARQLVRLDVPLMIGASVALLLVSLDGRISLVDGAIFFSALLAYVVWSIRESRRETPLKTTAPANASPLRMALHLAIAALGLLLLSAGANMLVASAVIMARVWQLSELVIGLTIVAVGTSLPELATSAVAAFRGERDIAVGNVVGSNTFNVLFVLGLSAIAAREGIPVSRAALGFDIPIMIAAAVACLPVFFTDHLIARWEGVLFVFYFCAYTAYLLLAAAQHAVLQGFNTLMLYFVIPITVLTLGVLAVRAYRSQK
jgi:cation:H+ antiporter